MSSQHTAVQPVPGDVPSPSPVRIKVVENGPLQVKGDIELLDHDGTPYPTRRTTFLCRCGRSATKPFCDGSHARTGFTAPERAGSDS